MKCDCQEIPTYLHWNFRITHSDKDYLSFHKLYRLKQIGNPIEIPAKWITAISCRWSKFIKKNHILLQPIKKLGDDYDFVFVRELRTYERKRELSEKHELNGIHSLTCIFKHSPLPCDYSHTEILIRHRVYRPEEKEPFFDETYTYESWANETAQLKRGKSIFFKDLKKDFRTDMIKLISRSSSANSLSTDVKAFFNFIEWNTLKD